MAFGRSSKDDDDTLGGKVAAAPIPAAIGRTDAFLGKGTKIVGTLILSGIAEIDGVVEGEVITQEKLTIGEGAVVKGKVQGSEVIVRGEVNGEIIANKKLSLRRPAKVTGSVACASLSVEEGVVFEASCTMQLPKTAVQPGSNVVSIAGRVA